MARTWLAYDPATGVFTWRKLRHKNDVPGARADKPSTGNYLRINIFGRSYAAHRVAWLITYGAWPAAHIDHKNRDRSDNRLDNLREATPAENIANRAATAPGLKGTTWHNGSWRAQITHHRVTHHLGSYSTQEEAHAAYCIGAAYFHGRFANTESLTGPVADPVLPPTTNSFELALREVLQTKRARRKVRPTLGKSTDLPKDLKDALLAMHENFTLTEKS
jgi:hypothetical protein